MADDVMIALSDFFVFFSTTKLYNDEYIKKSLNYRQVVEIFLVLAYKHKASILLNFQRAIHQKTLILFNFSTNNFS